VGGWPDSAEIACHVQPAVRHPGGGGFHPALLGYRPAGGGPRRVLGQFPRPRSFLSGGAARADRGIEEQPGREARA
jgi:hypothetical protein